MSAPKVLCIGKGTQDVFLRSDEFDPHKEGKKLYTHLPLGLKMEVEDEPLVPVETLQMSR